MSAFSFLSKSAGTQKMTPPASEGALSPSRSNGFMQDLMRSHHDEQVADSAGHQAMSAQSPWWAADGASLPTGPSLEICNTPTGLPGHASEVPIPYPAYAGLQSDLEQMGGVSSMFNDMTMNAISHLS